MPAFPEMNGIHISPTDDEVINLGLSVASGKADYETVLNWIIGLERKQSYAVMIKDPATRKHQRYITELSKLMILTDAERCKAQFISPEELCLN